MSAAGHPTIILRLGGVTYRAPRLNMGQWRLLNARFVAFGKIADPDEVAMFEHGVELAKIVLSRLEPPIEDFDALECAPAELRAATTAVLEFSGFAHEGDAPGKPAAAGD